MILDSYKAISIFSTTALFISNDPPTTDPCLPSIHPYQSRPAPVPPH